MPAPIYRKTDAGREEVGGRKAGLSPLTRRVLILVNGQDGAAALAALGLPDLQSHLDTLLAFRLIEAVPGPTGRGAAAPVAAPAPATTPTSVPMAAPPRAAPPAPAPATPAPVVDPAEDQLVQQLQRKAFLRLRQHFGPDTPIVAQGVFAARTLLEFREALGGLESKLAIYMGRKQAARELDTLRGEL